MAKNGFPVFHQPLKEKSPPLTPEQAAIVLGRGDHAPEPATPEEWALHACQSMYAIARLIQAENGPIPEDVGYRPIAPVLMGVNVLYFDSQGPDEYEVRVQPHQETGFVHDHATPEERETGLADNEARARRLEAVPEYRWSGVRPRAVTVQVNAEELPLDQMSEDPEAVLRLAEGHSRYLRAVAIYVATDMGNEGIVAELTPPEAHEATRGS